MACRLDGAKPLSEPMMEPLVQIMAWRCPDDKPLSEPMMEYCQLDPWEQISVKS